MFNYMQFNHYSHAEEQDIAKAVWDHLLCAHEGDDDFGWAIKELLRLMQIRCKSRVLLEQLNETCKRESCCNQESFHR